MDRQKYENARPLAVKCMMQDCSILILDIVYGINDYAATCFVNGDKRTSITRNKLYYWHDNTYFRKCGERYNLSDFIKLEG